MKHDRTTRPLWEGTVVIASILAAFFMIRSAVATGQAPQPTPQPAQPAQPAQANPFRGRVTSSAGAVRLSAMAAMRS